MRNFRTILAVFVAVILAVAVGFGIIRADSTADASLGPDDLVTTTSTEEPSTTTTVAPAFGELLTAWSDAEKAVAFEAFESERLRLEAEAEAEAEAQRQAEREAQAAAQAEAEREAEAQRSAAPPAPAQYGSGACGGDLPPCYVMMRESGGDITAQNPTSTASGKWQFIDSTWANYMGYAKARLAPEWVQDQKAREVWSGGAGCQHWLACG